MRYARHAVGAMTGLVIAATFYEAWFGDDIGLVFIGLAISIAGVFFVALAGDRGVG